MFGSTGRETKTFRDCTSPTSTLTDEDYPEHKLPPHFPPHPTPENHPSPTTTFANMGRKRAVVAAYNKTAKKQASGSLTTPATSFNNRGKRLYVGRRLYSQKFIGIDDSARSRMFQPNPTPGFPQYGIWHQKAQDAEMELKAQAIADDDEATVRQQLHTPPRSYFKKKKQTRNRSEEEEEEESLYQYLTPARVQQFAYTSIDEDRFFCFVKNRLATFFRWDGTKIKESVVRDALGLDEQHPLFHDIAQVGSKNRDVWQNRILDNCNVFAQQFYQTEKGKIWCSKHAGRTPIRYSAEGKLLIILPKVADLPETFKTWDTAKAIFHPIHDGIDWEKMEHPDGSPNFFGRNLINRAVSLILLEINSANRFLDGVKHTYHPRKHDRRPEYIFDFLAKIDSLHIKTTEVPIDDNGVIKMVKVARLFPIPTDLGMPAKRKRVQQDVDRDSFDVKALDDNTDVEDANLPYSDEEGEEEEEAGEDFNDDIHARNAEYDDRDRRRSRADEESNDDIETNGAPRYRSSQPTAPTRKNKTTKAIQQPHDDTRHGAEAEEEDEDFIVGSADGFKAAKVVRDAENAKYWEKVREEGAEKTRQEIAKMREEKAREKAPQKDNTNSQTGSQTKNNRPPSPPAKTNAPMPPKRTKASSRDSTQHHHGSPSRTSKKYQQQSRTRSPSVEETPEPRDTTRSQPRTAPHKRKISEELGLDRKENMERDTEQEDDGFVEDDEDLLSMGDHVNERASGRPDDDDGNESGDSQKTARLDHGARVIRTRSKSVASRAGDNTDHSDDEEEEVSRPAKKPRTQTPAAPKKTGTTRATSNRGRGAAKTSRGGKR